jgi:hypothetical protein
MILLKFAHSQPSDPYHVSVAAAHLGSPKNFTQQNSPKAVSFVLERCRSGPYICRSLPGLERSGVEMCGASAPGGR